MWTGNTQSGAGENDGKSVQATRLLQNGQLTPSADAQPLIDPAATARLNAMFSNFNRDLDSFATQTPACGPIILPINTLLHKNHQQINEVLLTAAKHRQNARAQETAVIKKQAEKDAAQDA